MGLDARGPAYVIYGWVLAPDLWGKERSWRLNHLPMASHLISHGCHMEPPLIPQRTRFGELLGCEYVEVWREWHA